MGFLLAVTIVLSLLPIYLPKAALDAQEKSSEWRRCEVEMRRMYLALVMSDRFYLEYEANGNASTSLTGTGTNPSEIDSRV